MSLENCNPLSPLVRQLIDFNIDSDDDDDNSIGYDSDGDAGPMAESWDVFHEENSVPVGDIPIDEPTNQDNAGATDKPNDVDTDELIVEFLVNDVIDKMKVDELKVELEKEGFQS